jgi:hypothetical protein
LHLDIVVPQMERTRKPALGQENRLYHNFSIYSKELAVGVSFQVLLCLGTDAFFFHRKG